MIKKKTHSLALDSTFSQQMDASGDCIFLMYFPMLSYALMYIKYGSFYESPLTQLSNNAD